jgi:GDP-L-fucose synthase
MPTNLFGVRDNYHSENSHLVAALIRKIYEAKINQNDQVQLWGTGNPCREILSSDAAADAALYFMDHYTGSEIINIGLGVDYTIREIAEMIKEVVEYQGKVIFDPSKPDGMMKKQLDVSRARNLGWVAKNNIIADLQIAYLDFQQHYQTYCTDKV